MYVANMCQGEKIPGCDEAADPEKTAEELLRTALSSTEMHTRPDFLHREMRKYTTPRSRVANTSEAPAVEEAARERVELRGANHKERAAREAQTFASSEGFARDALQTRYENEALVLTVSSPTRNSNNKRASHESQRNQLGQMEFALQIKPTGQINLEMFSRGQSRDEGLTELDLSGYDANLDKFDVMKFKAKDKNPNL
eukprot:gene10086-11938_t